MSPADVLAIGIGATLALYLGYRAVMWLAGRVIKAVDEITRFERL